MKVRQIRKRKPVPVMAYVQGVVGRAVRRQFRLMNRRPALPYSSAGWSVITRVVDEWCDQHPEQLAEAHAAWARWVTSA